jgi:hypothetical protein
VENGTVITGGFRRAGLVWAPSSAAGIGRRAPLVGAGGELNAAAGCGFPIGEPGSKGGGGGGGGKRQQLLLVLVPSWWWCPTKATRGTKGEREREETTDEEGGLGTWAFFFSSLSLVPFAGAGGGRLRKRP